MRLLTLLLKFTLLLPLSIPHGAAAQGMRSGLLIYKENSLTADEFALVIEFRSLEVFNTVNNVVAADGTQLSVITSLVMSRVDYDRVRPAAFPTILGESDLVPVKRVEESLETISRRYPAARKYLSPFVVELTREQERFRQGQGKLAGQWYVTREVAMEERNRPLRMAAAERARQEQMEAAEKARREAVAKAEAERAAAEAKMRAAVMEATAAAEKLKAEELSAEIAAVLKRVVIDKTWAEPAKDLAQVQPIPKELLRSVEEMNSRWKSLQQEIKTPEARRMCERVAPGLEATIAWSRAAQLFAAFEAPQAASVLRDFLSRYSAATNPELATIWDRMLDIHRICRQQEDEAQVRLRKGDQFAASGQNGKAIIEYQAAYSLFPDPRITAQIAKLRKEGLGL